MGLQFGFEEVLLETVDGSDGGALQDMVGCTGGEQVDLREGDGSSGR